MYPIMDENRMTAFSKHVISDAKPKRAENCHGNSESLRIMGSSNCKTQSDLIEKGSSTFECPIKSEWFYNSCVERGVEGILSSVVPSVESRGSSKAARASFALKESARPVYIFLNFFHKQLFFFIPLQDTLCFLFVQHNLNHFTSSRID